MQLNCITRKRKIIVVRASCPHRIYKLNTQQLSVSSHGDEYMVIICNGGCTEKSGEWIKVENGRD